MPPIPLQNNDDVRVLRRLNSDQTLSVPLCLVISKKASNIIGNHYESQSSNHDYRQLDTGGTVVHETKPSVVPPFVDKGEEIMVEVPDVNVGNDDSFIDMGLDDFDSGFPNDDMDGTAFGSPIGQQFDREADCEDSIEIIPPERRLPPIPPTDFVPPFYGQDCERPEPHNSMRKTSVGTGQSGVGNDTNFPQSEDDSIQFEDDFEIDQVFLSRVDLEDRLALISITNNREHKIKKADKSRLIAVCIDSACKWRLRASKVPEGNLWLIRRYNNAHTCSLDVRNHDHRNATSRLLGKIVKYHFEKLNHTCTPNATIAEIKARLSVNISYEKAWRARE